MQTVVLALPHFADDGKLLLFMVGGIYAALIYCNNTIDVQNTAFHVINGSKQQVKYTSVKRSVNLCRFLKTFYLHVL